MGTGKHVQAVAGSDFAAGEFFVALTGRDTVTSRWTSKDERGAGAVTV